jgi:HAD superfamily hydrolase (TIGR01509 family)
VINGVIFDMDGVLVDSEPLHLTATRDLLARYGVPFTDADNEGFIGRTDPEMFGILCARHPQLPGPQHLADARVAAVVALVGRNSHPLPGVPAVPRALRAAGYRTAVASSSDPRVIDATLAAAGLGADFDIVVSGLTVPRSKPAPDIFLATAHRLGVSPAACAVIEDSPNGVTAARAAGMLAVAIPCSSTARLAFDDADYRLRSLLEVPTLLERLRDRPSR